MAGKTKINGISYTIKGGKCKVNGASYSIGGGCTKVDGVAKRITFSRLPSGFQECEYIEGTGTQWIDFGYQPTTNTKSVIDWTIKEKSGGVVWGFCNSDSSDYRFFTGYGGTSLHAFYCEYDFNSSRIETSSAYFTNGQRYQLEIGNYYIKNLTTNTNIVSGSTQSSVPTGSITMFYMGVQIYDSISKGVIWAAQMYEGSTLTRNYIPCYCTTTVTGYKGSTAVSCASGTIGMYDLVGNRFYINSGSGTFTKGADV